MTVPLATLTAAFERLPDPVVIVDRAHQRVWANPAAAGELDEVCDALRAAVDHAFAGAEPARFGTGREGAGGIERWWDVVVSTMAVDGAELAVAIARDVTAAKREEARLRRSEQLMVDAQGVAHLGTWEWDVTQPNATWSSELYKIYAVTPETYTPSYEAYLTKVHPDDRQRVMDATTAVFQDHVTYSHDERIFRPDGSIRYLHTWAYPVLDDTGALRRLVGVCQDITDRKEAQDALERLNAELEQRVDARTAELQRALADLQTFNTIVSHDLRGPMAVIQLVLEAVERTPGLPASASSQLARGKASMTKMIRLVGELMTIKRIAESGIEPTALDVGAIVERVVADQRLADPSRQVEVVMREPIRVVADPSLFHAVLENLIGNAWKYTAQASKARLEIGVVDRSDGRALYVRDNGIGFDMPEHDHLFEPFVRLSNAGEFDGLGVGLATVRRIVERHGGHILAEGSLDQGATFFVVLPEQCWA